MKQSTQWISLFLCFMFMYSIGNAQFQKSLDGAGDPPEKPKTTNTSRTTGGSGTAIVDIAINLPSSGYVVQDDLEVRWSHASLEPPFTFVLGMESGDDILRAAVNSTEYVVDLSTLQFDEDEHYYISVEKKKGDKLHQSKRANFDVFSADKIDMMMTEIDTTSEFQSATPFIQEMMRAYTLSENEYYVEAEKIYMKSIKDENSTKNTMIAIDLLKAMKEEKFRN